MSRHFRKRLYTVCHAPYRSGSSLHGAPPLAIHSIPFIALRFSHFAGRPRFPCFGCSGGSISLIRFHSLSVSSYRFVPICTVYINFSFCATFIFQTRPNLYDVRVKIEGHGYFATYGLQCARIDGQWQKLHSPTKYEHSVNFSGIFSLSRRILLSPIRQIDRLFQYPLKIDREYWDSLSNKKQGANRKAVRSSLKIQSRRTRECHLLMDHR